MKTQISRDSHRPEMRYSAVYQQMGRMITDADLNELAEIMKRRVDDALLDAIGDGTPRLGGARLGKADAAAPLLITPGHVYADGVIGQVVSRAGGTEAFEYTDQADFPGAPPLPETGGYGIYADVWERSVTALEDELAADGDRLADRLRDPALHGADTATRSQTMVQLKWAAQDALFPPKTNIGDARLTVTLRQTTEGADDDCDPCADTVDVDARTGNYLFRLEVHDFDGANLTLKWSSENAAEHHRLGQHPPGFEDTDHVYEIYDTTTEKHVGLHVADGFSPVRSELALAIPAADSLPAPKLVRRWDGYCVLERAVGDGSWSLLDGTDQGRPLTPALSDTIRADLRSLVIDLELDDREFLAGDYWLATIREDANPDAGVALEAALPRGIRHQYVVLGRVDHVTRELVEDPTLGGMAGADRRRLNFPRLTDLTAPDIGYVSGCESGFFDASHDTVQKALDHICDLTAEDITYDPEDCDLLSDASTVQGAIDALCKRPTGIGGGCDVVVGPGAEFTTIGEAIDAHRESTALCICLAPGEHVLTKTDEVDGLRLRVKSCGGGGRVRVEGPVKLAGFDSLTFEDIAFDLQSRGGIQADGCARVRVEDCEFIGGGMRVPQLGAVGFQHFEADGSIFRPRDDERAVRMAKVLGPLGLEEPFLGTLAVGEWARRLTPVLERLLAEPDIPDLLEAVRAGLDKLRPDLSETEIAVIDRIIDLLTRDRPQIGRLAVLVAEARRAAADAGFAVAIELTPFGGSASIHGCEIEGIVVTGGPFHPEAVLPDDLLERLKDVLSDDGEGLLGDLAGRLRLAGNRLGRLAIGELALSQLFDLLEGRSPDGLFRTTFISDNVIASNANHLAGRDIKLAANDFSAADEVLGWILGSSGIYLGNRGENVEARLVDATVRMKEDGANMLFFASP